MIDLTFGNHCNRLLGQKGVSLLITEPPFPSGNPEKSEMTPCTISDCNQFNSSNDKLADRLGNQLLGKSLLATSRDVWLPNKRNSAAYLPV